MRRMTNAPASLPAATLRGVLAPVLTPFDAQLAPDAGRFVSHCRWLLAQGVGLAMFGTNSEGNSLSVSEKRALLDALVDAGVPLAQAMPGTGSCSLTDAVALTRASVEAGCAGVLTLPPFYYKAPTEEGLFRFFAELVERVGSARLRVYLYHIPPVASVGFTPGLVARLLRAYPGTIAGMKDTGGDWAYTQAMIREFAAEGFDVFAGTEALLLDTLRAGGAGCISATANVNPARIVALARGFEAPGAEALQARLTEERGHFAAFPLIAAMKAALAHFRDDPAWATLRPPLTRLPAPEAARLVAQLSASRFAIAP